MLERLFRLVLVGVLCIALFLPWNRLSDSESVTIDSIPTGLFIVWVTLEIVPTMIRGIRGLYFINGLCIILFLWAIPLLMLFNIGLAVCPIRVSRWLKLFYRIFLLVTLCSLWYTVPLFYQSWRGIGFGASAAIIFTAGLIEIAFIINEQLKQPRNAVSAGE